MLLIWLREERLGLIHLIRVLLQDHEYNVKELEGKLVLFKGGSNIYPEDFIEIDRGGAIRKFTVYEVHRDVKQMKLQTEEEEEAFICAIILYKKVYDDIVDRKKARNIRNYVNTGEDEKALNYSIEGIADSLYAIGYEDNLKISFIKSNDKVDVKFEGEYLAKNASLSRGYVVLYNYCEKLQYISSFYDEIQNQLECKIDREKVLKWYILGK